METFFINGSLPVLVFADDVFDGSLVILGGTFLHQADEFGVHSQVGQSFTGMSSVAETNRPFMSEKNKTYKIHL